MNKDKKTELTLYIFLILSIAFGIYFRLKGLGKWPLAIDEYYIAQSVKNILNFGLPMWPSGGFYDRGIIYQYLTAGLMLTGLKAEFAIRIIPAITNLICLIPIYLISKKISGKILAAVLVFVFCFSVWEVEFARFGRMYAPFQMMFVWYLYFLYNNLIEGKSRSLKWLLILSFLSIFVYEGSVFLCILNFLPLIWDYENKKFYLSRISLRNVNITYLIFCILVFISAYLLIKSNFRYFGLERSELLPTQIAVNTEASGEGQFRLPKLFLFPLLSSKLFLLIYIIPVGIIAYSIYKIFINKMIRIQAKYVFALLIVFSIFNLFGLIAAFFILFYLNDWIKKEDVKHGLKFLAIPIITIFIFWTIFALKSDSWYYYFPNEHFASIKEIIKVTWKEFLNYPYFYETFVLFRDTIPVYTYIIITLLFIGAANLFFTKNNYRARLLFSLLIFLVLLVNILNLAYFDTRYFLFIFPLILILSFSSLENILQKIIPKENFKTACFIIISALILIASEDFNLNHLFRIDSKEINFRQNMTLAEKIHYYPRWDTRAPAEFINERRKSNDIVIINEQVNDFYLDSLSYVYRDYRSINFKGESIDRGRKERWTDAGLIYDDKDLINLLRNGNNTKWFLLNTIWSTRFLREDSFFVYFDKYAVYANNDSSAIVYKVPGESSK